MPAPQDRRWPWRANIVIWLVRVPSVRVTRADGCLSYMHLQCTDRRSPSAKSKRVSPITQKLRQKSETQTGWPRAAAAFERLPSFQFSHFTRTLSRLTRPQRNHESLRQRAHRRRQKKNGESQQPALQDPSSAARTHDTAPPCPAPHAATGWGVPLSTPPSSVRKAGPKRPVMPAACAPSELSKRRTLLIGATCRETAEI